FEALSKRVLGTSYAFSTGWNCMDCDISRHRRALARRRDFTPHSGLARSIPAPDARRKLGVEDKSTRNRLLVRRTIPHLRPGTSNWRHRIRRIDRENPSGRPSLIPPAGAEVNRDEKTLQN